jgi:DNA invertase Pin-like site-specific DNA recombinase
MNETKKQAVKDIKRKIYGIKTEREEPVYHRYTKEDDEFIIKNFIDEYKLSMGQIAIKLGCTRASIENRIGKIRADRKYKEVYGSNK